MELLSGWYPGYGEVETIRRMSPVLQEFISDAIAEDKNFLGDYLLPVLDGPDPENVLLEDLQAALCDLEFEEAGLGEFGNLGKSFFKKIKKAVKKVHDKVQKAILPKSVKKLVDKVEDKVSKAVTKAGEKVRETGKKVWKKYGNIIIGAVGLVLAPFTGGASLAAAAALTAANQAYMKKRAADQAKRMARADAGQLAAEAQQQQAAAEQELNNFYSQNQQWFIDNLDLTPDKWAQLTFEQKVDILQNGLAGRVPGNAPMPAPPESSAPMPAPQPMPSSGPTAGAGAGTSSGGGGGGLYPEGSSPSGGFAPAGAGSQQGPRVATASMFDGSMLPMLAAGVALAMVFGKPASGGRTKRNPGRRHRRAA